ncbi:MAG: hypothetical protein GY851_09530 [bacterium]|nr:hypothetical protein [bacterium]
MSEGCKCGCECRSDASAPVEEGGETRCACGGLLDSSGRCDKEDCCRA